MSEVKTKRRRWIWLVVLVLLAGGGVLFAKKRSSTEELDRALIVTLKKADLAIDVVETGKVQPRERADIKSKVAGQVQAVYVEEGAKVKTGTLLLRLDPTDYRRDVESRQAEVAQAKNALEFAQLSLERRQRGLEARGVAQADVDAALNEVKTRTVSLHLAQVALNVAEDRLRYTQIVAPIDGTVIERGIRPGEVVTPGVQATFEGKALLTIADLSTLIVKADLNQIDIAKCQLGQKVTVTLDALPGKTYEAKLTKIAPASITVKGKEVEVFPVEATLELADSAIKPGMTADVRIHIDVRRGVVALPIEAVVKDAGKSYVTRVVKGDHGKEATDKIEVKVGARNDREIEITSGVASGDRVLIKPASSSENEYKM